MCLSSITLTLLIKWTMIHKNERFPLTFISLQSFINSIVTGIICKSYGLFLENKIFNMKLLKPLVGIGNQFSKS